MPMPTKVFFCGEVVADLVEFQEGSGAFNLKLGGSQFHGAMGASRAQQAQKLDCEIFFVGPMSHDDFGNRFFAALENNKVNTSLIKRVDRNSTLAIVAVRPGQENSFIFYGRDTAEQMTQPQELPQSLPGQGDKICVFGSISTVLEPARFTWMGFAKTQKPDALIYYDLNTRPAIAKNPERYRGIVAEWAGMADIIKASSADIGWTYPGETPQQVAARWFAEGAKMAVFTLGEQGSLAITSHCNASVPSEAVKVKNTIGAGDNFNAGFALGLVSQNCANRANIGKINQTQLAAALQYANNTAKNHLVAQAA
jgi:fructokinase